MLSERGLTLREKLAVQREDRSTVFNKRFAEQREEIAVNQTIRRAPPVVVNPQR